MRARDFYTKFPLPPPPIEKRVRCPECGKARGIELVREGSTYDLELKKSIRAPATAWKYIYPLSGHFCTLRCANDYANKKIDQPAN